MAAKILNATATVLLGNRHTQEATSPGFGVHLSRRNSILFPLGIKGSDLFGYEASKTGTEGKMVIVVEGSFHPPILPLRPASCISHELTRCKSV